MSLPIFQCEDAKWLDFFGPMYQDMVEKLSRGQETVLCPPPNAPCSAGHFMGWFGLNAMAYGFRKGIAVAGATVEVKKQSALD